MVAITAAQTAARERAKTRTIDAFRTNDATATDRARPLAELGLSIDDDAVRKLVTDGVIRGVDNRGRLTVLGDSVHRVAGYYLDEPAYIAHRDKSSKASAVAVAIAVIAAMIVIVGAIALVVATRATR